MQQDRVESALRTQPAAYVDSKGLDDSHRLGDVVRTQPPGQEYGDRHRLANPAAHRPVVSSPGAPKFPERSGWVAGVAGGGATEVIRHRPGFGDQKRAFARQEAGTSPLSGGTDSPWP